MSHRDREGLRCSSAASASSCDSNCLRAFFYRSSQRARRRKGTIRTEENQGNEEVVGGNPWLVLRRSGSGNLSVPFVAFCEMD